MSKISNILILFLRNFQNLKPVFFCTVKEKEYEAEKKKRKKKNLFLLFPKLVESSKQFLTSMAFIWRVIQQLHTLAHFVVNRPCPMMSFTMPNHGSMVNWPATHLRTNPHGKLPSSCWRNISKEAEHSSSERVRHSRETIHYLSGRGKMCSSCMYVLCLKGGFGWFFQLQRVMWKCCLLMSKSFTFWKCFWKSYLTP